MGRGKRRSPRALIFPLPSLRAPQLYFSQGATVGGLCKGESFSYRKKNWLGNITRFGSSVPHTIWQTVKHNWCFPKSVVIHYPSLRFPKQPGYLQYTAGMFWRGLRKLRRRLQLHLAEFSRLTPQRRYIIIILIFLNVHLPFPFPTHRLPCYNDDGDDDDDDMMMMMMMTDTLGVTLLDTARVWSPWESQQRHISCLHASDAVQLYTKIGTLVKGG